MSETIKVDIWSDVQCPWCYIGKRKFEAGAALFDGKVEVEYHSFELAPDTPVDFDGSPVDYLSQRKGLPIGQVEQITLGGQATNLFSGVSRSTLRCPAIEQANTELELNAHVDCVTVNDLDHVRINGEPTRGARDGTAVRCLVLSTYPGNHDGKHSCHTDGNDDINR